MLTVTGLPKVFPLISEILLALGIVESHAPNPCSLEDRGVFMLIQADASRYFEPSAL